jgi:hypothetical protein
LKIAYFGKTSPERGKTDNSHLQTKFHGGSGKIIKTACCLTDSCRKTGFAGLKMGLNSVDIKKTFFFKHRFKKFQIVLAIYTLRAIQRYMGYGVYKHRPRRRPCKKIEKIQKTYPCLAYQPKLNKATNGTGDRVVVGWDRDRDVESSIPCCGNCLICSI